MKERQLTIYVFCLFSKISNKCIQDKIYQKSFVISRTFKCISISYYGKKSNGKNYSYKCGYSIRLVRARNSYFEFALGENLKSVVHIYFFIHIPAPWSNLCAFTRRFPCIEFCNWCLQPSMLTGHIFCLRIPYCIFHPRILLQIRQLLDSGRSNETQKK